MIQLGWVDGSLLVLRVTEDGKEFKVSTSHRIIEAFEVLVD